MVVKTNNLLNVEIVLHVIESVESIAESRLSVGLDPRLVGNYVSCVGHI